MLAQKRGQAGEPVACGITRNASVNYGNGLTLFH
ncbi:Uncharacterised protein [Vibrio cholerae]|nr:Uncharacterised protein [Vibrio cholerae]